MHVAVAAAAAATAGLGSLEGWGQRQGSRGPGRQCSCAGMKGLRLGEGAGGIGPGKRAGADQRRA